jgi:hypothetical protein
VPPRQSSYARSKSVADKHDAVDAAVEENADFLKLLLGIVFRIRDEEGIAMIPEPTLQRSDSVCKYRYTEHRDHRSDSPAPSRLQGSCCRIWGKAE